MNHAPFIWASYLIGAFVMLWCAVSPLLRKKAAIRTILQIKRIEESKVDSNP